MKQKAKYKGKKIASNCSGAYWDLGKMESCLGTFATTEFIEAIERDKRHLGKRTYGKYK